jgi:hypothetical protein
MPYLKIWKNNLHTVDKSLSDFWASDDLRLFCVEPNFASYKKNQTVEPII